MKSVKRYWKIWIQTKCIIWGDEMDNIFPIFIKKLYNKGIKKFNEKKIKLLISDL